LGELGDVLELLHGARHSYTTIHARLEDRVDWRRHPRGVDRWRDWRREAHAGLSEPFREILIGAEGGSASVAPDQSTGLGEVWIERPDRSRLDLSVDGPSGLHRVVAIRVGHQNRSYHSNPGVRSLEGAVFSRSRFVRLFEPWTLLGHFEFELKEEFEHRSGRMAVLLSGVPSGPTLPWPSLGLAPGASSFEFVVDASRGVLLGIQARADETTIEHTELTDIVFDEAIAPALFTDLPGSPNDVALPEARVGASDLGGARLVTLEQAAEMCRFRVFEPVGIPADAIPTVTVVPGIGGDPDKQRLSIRYARPAPTTWLRVLETAESHAWTDRRTWRRVELDGIEFFVWESTGLPSELPRAVQVRRDGTLVELQSEIPVADLVELAKSLAPL
jgi:hypothetical protein